MDLVFTARYGDHEVTARAARPMTTRLSVAVDGRVVADSSRPISTDLFCGIKTWFGMRPVWEISGKAEIDGQKRAIAAKHYTTFTGQYVELFVDGEMIGPEGPPGQSLGQKQPER